MYGYKIYGAVLCIVIGSGLSNAHSMLADDGSDPISMLGVTVCVISLMAASLRPVSPPVPVSAAVDSAPSASCCRLCCRRSPTQFCVPCLRDASVSSELIA